MYIEKINSTNAYLLSLSKKELLPEYSMVYTYQQTEGRGQQGNTWDSEKGKNLLLSVLVHPHEVAVEQQFLISQWVAVTLVQVLDTYVQDVCIKWPNDIYVADKKLCGILIENEIISSRLANVVVGIGLNINQISFPKNIPNPISLRQILGRTLSKKEILRAFLTHLKENRYLLSIPEKLKQVYMARLYRREGWYKYAEVTPSCAPINISYEDTNAFLAKIVDVDSYGRILLQNTEKKQKLYHFKEIKIVL